MRALLALVPQPAAAAACQAAAWPMSDPIWTSCRYGIDAPETKQLCTAGNGSDYACGQVAKAALEQARGGGPAQAPAAGPVAAVAVTVAGARRRPFLFWACSSTM